MLNTMVTAPELVAAIRGDLTEVGEKLTRHPYLAALEAKRFEADRLKLFTGEQHQIVNSDLRSISLLVNRNAHLPSRDYLLGLLHGEAAALSDLPALASALGMSAVDLRDYEPLPGCQVYPAYVAWLALYGSDADFASAFLVNLPAWGSACARMSLALRLQYELPPGATAFLDAFARGVPEFEAESLKVVQDGLDRGLDPRDMARSARLLQTYELVFWDTLYEASA